MSQPKKQLYLKELGKFILIRPFVAYKKEKINILESRLPTKNQKYRDESLEQGFIELLIGFHPKFAENISNQLFVQDFLSISQLEFAEKKWFLDFFDKLRQAEVEIFGFDDFKNFKFTHYLPKMQVAASSKNDWFEVDISVQFGDMSVKMSELRRAAQERDEYVLLSDGKLGMLPLEWLEKVKKYLRLGQVEKGKLRVSKLRFNALDELFDTIDQNEIREELKAKKDKLLQFENISRTALPEVKAQLRDYQNDGYQWLHFLHEYGWGGILADDMGLGKTLQMITFLKSLVDRGIKNNLVVVPTSLLFNWQNEIDKFCPELDYLLYYGSNRKKLEEEVRSADVIITTYGLLVSDIKLLKEQQFGYIILDESQAIKNPSSKRYKAAAVLNGHNKVAMTGTPIENNTMDLYAQMSFTNPGLLVSTHHFKKYYATPIDRYGNKEAAEELGKMIHPFMLRRTKEMVATELPPKTESVLYCEMDAPQRKLYNALKDQYKNEFNDLIAQNSFDQNKMHVLQALTKLRQICNAAQLLNDDEYIYEDASVKIDTLEEHIQEKTGNHKILIFSQFVGMLQLIKKKVEDLGVAYCYLDGQTTKNGREKAVEQFQNDENTRVFLISLKAGGTGLTLTAADYVYIVDPWCNPAVENQAIDRCYRIGQDKKVIAYRMICKDTIEEKIMEYQSKKTAVSDSIISTDETIGKQISKDDILALLS